MIKPISKYNINFNKSESNYNQYGGEKLLRDPNSPSNKVKKDSFEKKHISKKDNIKTVLALSFGFSALFYGILKKSDIF